MRVVCAAAALWMLSACSAQPPAELAAPACPDPRPQVCTMEYAPACALLRDGTRRQYSSACNACADDAVVDILPGPCPE